MANLQKYIDHCRTEGITKDSLLMEIEDAIVNLMTKEGFGYGAGYYGDAQDTLEAYERAARIAQKIDGKL
jgi:hypothetical protein